MPVLVFAPIAESVPVSRKGFVSRVMTEPRLEAIGALTDWHDDDDGDLNAIEKLKRDLDGLGIPAEVSYRCRAYSSSPNNMGNLFALSVTVESVTIAKTLPSFVSWYTDTKEWWLPPENLSIPAGATVHKFVFADHHPAGSIPKYDQDGWFVVSLIPLGQLVSLVYTERDPDHFFSVWGSVKTHDAQHAVLDYLADNA